MSRAPADRLIVHARKALLQGLTPRQNREVPPLRYDAVQRLKEARPELLIEINGGFTTLSQARPAKLTVASPHSPAARLCLPCCCRRRSCCKSLATADWTV